MLPLVLVLSILAFFDGADASYSVPRWRPDLRRNGLITGERTTSHRRQVLEGIATDAPVTTNSTIVPVVLASDKQ